MAKSLRHMLKRDLATETPEQLVDLVVRDVASGLAMLADFDVASAPGNERQAMDRVMAAVASSGLAPARLDRLRTAVAEATMNAMEHGNEYRLDRPVRIVVLRTAEDVRVRITDQGDMNRSIAPETPDIEAKLAGSEPPRGWGLFLIAKMVDEVILTSDGGAPTVELVMRLEGGGNE
jgi:anti-sigma regulatory factor (Ser/Thr protein kinase)